MEKNNQLFGNTNCTFRANLYTGFASQTFIHFNRLRMAVNQLKHSSRTVINTFPTTSTFILINSYLSHIHSPFVASYIELFNKKYFQKTTVK